MMVGSLMYFFLELVSHLEAKVKILLSLFILVWSLSSLFIIILFREIGLYNLQTNYNSLDN